MVDSLPAMDTAPARHDWTVAEIEAIYTAPFPDLVFRAQTVHRLHHRPDEIQGCQLLSIKTGGCPEDCAYCPQSAHYDTPVSRGDLAELAAVEDAARRAREQGATRFCMGAAWRDVPEGPQFDRVLEMVRVVRGLGLEACCTLGMLTDAQAERLADAGLSAYNHNLDTSPEYYPEIISTRTYDDRLRTLDAVRGAGISVCCGGIIGMGEGDEDVVDLGLALRELGVDSLPLNFLHPIPGTPLGDRRPVDAGRALRALSLMRLLNPEADIRAAGGRERTLGDWQPLVLYPANSIFVNGYLTTPGQAAAEARRMCETLGFALESEIETLEA